MLIYIKDSGFSVAVRECTVIVLEINFTSGLMLIYIKDSGYSVAVREITLSV
jgi:hypothetical protein